jgi:hypothetical protein
MPTEKLGLITQTDGTTNWDDAVETNWQKLDQLLALTGLGPPSTSVVGTFVGQRYWDSVNNRGYVCVDISPPSLWLIDDGLPIGTMVPVLSIIGPPAGWLSLGQTVPVAVYPRLAAALAGTGAIVGSNIVLPSLVDPTAFYQVTSPASIGTITGGNTVTAGGAHTPEGSMTAAGGHNHGGVTGTSSATASVAAGSGASAIQAGHLHGIDAVANHTHILDMDAVAAHTHALALRKLGCQIFIKAF